MTLKEKILSGIALVSVCVLLIREGCVKAEKDRLVDKVATYSDSAKSYQLKVNGLRVKIDQNQSLILQSKSQLESVISQYGDTIKEMVRRFKAVSSVTVIKGGVIIERDTIKIPNPIPCSFSPVKIRRDSLHYSFRGTIAPDYFSIDSLAVPNTQSIVIGSRKMGFLKRPENRVEIVNSNPLIKTTNIGSFVVRTPKKWYDRPVIGFAVGLAGGAYLYHKFR